MALSAKSPKQPGKEGLKETHRIKKGSKNKRWVPTMTFFQILGRLFLSLKRGLDSKWATNYLGCKSNSLFF